MTVCIYVVMLWFLWNNRNNSLWNNENRGANQFGLQAFNNWKDWFIAQNNHQDTENEHQQQSLEPPHEGWVNAMWMPDLITKENQ